MKKRAIIFSLILVFILFSSNTFASKLPSGYLQYGSRGLGVREIQKTLNIIGYHIQADGIYGRATKNAILDFQRKYKELSNDGIYGASTKNIMEKIINGEDIAEFQREEDLDKNEKIAYLTFDDGPSTSVTPKILDILNEHDIKATFFVLGSMAEKNPDMLKRIHDEGHSIGNHSYSHKYNVVYKNMDSFLSEISSTDKIFKKILGEDFNTSLLRFPGGSFEAYKQKYVKAANDRGYKIYNWNALNGDSEVKSASVDKLISRLKQTTKNHKELVVLMHDNKGKDTTAKALPDIIKYLREKGYSFDKLEE